MEPHKLPKQENVTEFEIPDGRVAVVRVTPESKDAIVEMAMSMYLGEQCKYCLRAFETLDDLRTAVYAGYHEHGRVACKLCWDANN